MTSSRGTQFILPFIKPGFLNLSTIDIWGWVTIFYGRLSYALQDV